MPLSNFSKQKLWKFGWRRVIMSTTSSALNPRKRLLPAAVGVETTTQGQRFDAAHVFLFLETRGIFHDFRQKLRNQSQTLRPLRPLSRESDDVFCVIYLLVQKEKMHIESKLPLDDLFKNEIKTFNFPLCMLEILKAQLTFDISMLIAPFSIHEASLEDGIKISRQNFKIHVTCISIKFEISI